jgi:hypothetical protein
MDQDKDEKSSVGNIIKVNCSTLKLCKRRKAIRRLTHAEAMSEVWCRLPHPYLAVPARYIQSDQLYYSVLRTAVYMSGYTLRIVQGLPKAPDGTK